MMVKKTLIETLKIKLTARCYIYIHEIQKNMQKTKFPFLITIIFTLLCASSCGPNNTPTTQSNNKDSIITSPNTTMIEQNIDESKLNGCNDTSTCFNLNFDRKKGDRLFINVSFNEQSGKIIIYQKDETGEIVTILNALNSVASLGMDISHFKDGTYLMLIDRRDLNAKVGISIQTK